MTEIVANMRGAGAQVVKHRWLRWRFATLLLWVTAGGAGWAATVTGLYEAEVPVAGQSAEQRDAAVRAAFLLVATRITGSRRAEQQPGFDSLSAKAPDLVQQYRYRRTEGPAEAAMGQSRLWVQFDPGAVNRLLREHGLPVWGGKRPAVLLWLASEQAGESTLVGADTVPEWLDALVGVARERGIPLLFPLLDLQDRQKLTGADLQQGAADRILAASQRYAPDLALGVRVSAAAADTWRADWVLLQGADSAEWTTREQTAEAALAAGLNQAGDRLAQRFAPEVGSSRSAGRVRLRVGPVDDLRAYRRILEYLAGLNGVADVGLALVEPGAVTYEVSLRVGRRELEQALSAGSVLRAEGWAGEPQRAETTVQEGTAGRGPAAEAGGDAAGDIGEFLLDYRVLP
jgi:hypothetical protein